MKTLFILLLLPCFLLTHAQNRIQVPSHLQDICLKKEYMNTLSYETNPQIPLKNLSAFAVDEEQIGETRYDNQSNASIPKKIYFYEDGTIAATWTRSMEEGNFFADRGTGYNYFDGNEWDEWPSERVEDTKVHRPVYAPLGENGELIVSHISEQGLYLATRPDKGSGDWEFESFSGPPAEDYILWCRAVTSGIDRNRIHLLALTLPTTHWGSIYEGLDGALLYSLSTDGGQSWTIEHEIPDGMTSDEYRGFGGDTYAFAEPKDDIIAFVVGEPWVGLFLMKSTDGGETFEKTVIWDHPYPDWEPETPTDTFYCADGSHSAVIGSDGTVHVAFGINRAHADDNGTYWYPWVDGIAYWNENMPTFSNNLNALNPNNHPESELVEDENLIAWTQDINGNGQLDFLDEMGLYWIGLSSMPQLTIDENDNIILVYSSVTETYDNGSKNYRHLWARASANGQNWGQSNFLHLTSDLVHIFDECVYPAVAARSDDYFYMIYQHDSEPGTAVWGSQHSYQNNSVSFMKEEKYDIPIGTGGKKNKQHFSVSQNYPNPFTDLSKIIVENYSSTDLEFEIISITGQQIFNNTIRNVGPGKHIFDINGSEFNTGIYFYTISDGETSITKKMVVE